MNRRKFLGTVSCVVGLPLSTKLSVKPRDDAPWLQSVIDRGETLQYADLVLRTPVILRGQKNFDIRYCRVTLHNKAHIKSSKSWNGLFGYTYFVCKPGWTGPALVY